MKKSIFTIVMVFAASMLVNSQIMKIQLKDGNVIPVPLKDIASITYDMEGAIDGKKAELVSDPMIGDMMQLASMAQQYYRKPIALGGGGNGFVGWVIPENMKENKNGSFTAKIEFEKVTLVGISKTTSRDGKPMKLMIVVTNDRITETTMYSAEKDQAQDAVDAILSDMTALASMAQQYYKKPTVLGGGGNSFKGWSIPANLKEASPNGSYSEKVTNGELITITGDSKRVGPDGKSFKVIMEVGSDRIRNTNIIAK